MKLPPEDWFFLLGLFVVTGLVVYHIDQAGVVAALVGSHKGISVLDGKFMDRQDGPVPPPPNV
jgi:hypothetical protein